MNVFPLNLKQRNGVWVKVGPRCLLNICLHITEINKSIMYVSDITDQLHCIDEHTDSKKKGNLNT